MIEWQIKLQIKSQYFNTRLQLLRLLRNWSFVMQVGKGQQRTMALKLLDVFQNQVTGCFLSNWAYLAIWTRKEQGSSSRAKVLHWQFFKTGSWVVQLYTLISRILFLLLSVGIQETPFASEGPFIESVGLHLPSSNMLLFRHWSAQKLARDFRWKLALCFASYS